MAIPGASVMRVPGSYSTMRPAIWGSSSAKGVASNGPDGGLAPLSFTAQTVNSYSIPFFKPPMTTRFSSPETETRRSPGETSIMYSMMAEALLRLSATASQEIVTSEALGTAVRPMGVSGQLRETTSSIGSGSRNSDSSPTSSDRSPSPAI